MLRFMLGECEFAASLSRQFGSSLWMSGGGHGARRYAGAVIRPRPSSASIQRRDGTGFLLRSHAMAGSGRHPALAPTLTLALLLLVKVYGRAQVSHSLMAPMRAATRFSRATVCSVPRGFDHPANCCCVEMLLGTNLGVDSASPFQLTVVQFAAGVLGVQVATLHHLGHPSRFPEARTHILESSLVSPSRGLNATFETRGRDWGG